jgi:hypothetical protein
VLKNCVVRRGWRVVDRRSRAAVVVVGSNPGSAVLQAEARHATTILATDVDAKLPAAPQPQPRRVPSKRSVRAVSIKIGCLL